MKREKVVYIKFAGTLPVYDLTKDGNMTFAKGFENGKRIIFPKDVNNSKAKDPDSEGITVDGNGSGL